MPHKKIPEKLQASCIRAIAYLLKRLNDNDLPASFAWFSRTSNPFVCCNGALLQDIISHLGDLMRGDESTFIHKDIMRLLLCRNMDHLDLSALRIRHDHVTEVLSMVRPFATNLQTFSLYVPSLGIVLTRNQFCETLQKNSLGDSVLGLGQSLTSITHLFLHDICFDELLDVIGKNCPNLIVLRALSEYITDVGLKSLCFDFNHPENGELRCQNIQKVSIDPRAERISTDGIECLLLHLPHLTEVEGCIIGHVLETLHEHDHETCTKIYRLQHFMHDWHESQHDPLLAATIAVKTCPFITTLKLLEPSDEALVIFGNLRFLTGITIITYTNPTTFDGGVLPLLRRAGENVTKLALSLKNIDLVAIDFFCPKLQCLDCNTVEDISESALQSGTPFRNLQDLVFHANTLATLTANSIRILLSSCLNLQSLYISCCNNLTDDLLHEILQINPLKNLQYLHLMYVEGLTIAGLELLVSQDNDLKRLWLFDTRGIYRTALRKIKNSIKEQNLDLIINDDLL